MASMESAIQAAREFLENQDHREILVNGATQGFRVFVMFPCVIRPTTSGNTTAKDPTSDDTAAWERLLLRNFMTKCAWRTAALEAEITSIVELK